MQLMTSWSIIIIIIRPCLPFATNILLMLCMVSVIVSVIEDMGCCQQGGHVSVTFAEKTNVETTSVGVGEADDGGAAA